MTRDMLAAELARCLPPEVFARAEKLLSEGGDVDAFLIEHGALIDAAFPDTAPVLRFKLVHFGEKAMPSELAAAMGELEAYVSAGDPSRSAPHAACRVLAALARRHPHPSRAAALLLGAAALASRMPYDDWDGQDLRNVQPFVVAMGSVAQLPDRTVRYLASVLQSNTQQEHHAAPGSPDADKYDRDRDAESSQDALALAAVQSLAAFRGDAALALDALDAASSHRSGRVAALARDVAAAVRYYKS